MSLGNAIKTIRKQRGMKQFDLAGRADMSINSLCSIETDNAFPQRETLRRIAHELQVPVSFLMLYAIEEEEIKLENRKAFRIMLNGLKELITT